MFRILLIVALATLAVANDIYLEREESWGNQKHYTGTELPLSERLPERSEAVGFQLINPPGRGASKADNTRGPCGQYRGTAPVGQRIECTTDDYITVDVHIQDANGGGVVSQYFGAGPDPIGPLFQDWYNDKLRFIVPDEDNKIYRIKLKLPPMHFEGPGTIQLVYNSCGRESHQHWTPAKSYFQCIDVLMDAPAASVQVSMSLLVGLLATFFLF